MQVFRLSQMGRDFAALKTENKGKQMVSDLDDKDLFNILKYVLS